MAIEKSQNKERKIPAKEPSSLLKAVFAYIAAFEKKTRADFPRILRVLTLIKGEKLFSFRSYQFCSLLIGLFFGFSINSNKVYEKSLFKIRDKKMKRCAGGYPKGLRKDSNGQGRSFF
ncbi:hypothetical protein ACQCVP_11360 [Rossellomorea vietnamensis]|uniref:hypothetical protein n=1 Tax=Rossellomorea vietnamensis TaxID=218284 RepID=UPI003CE7ECF5